MNLLKKTALCLAIAGSSWATFASEAMEEVIVTARQQAEGLQDVPVTIAAMTEEDLDRYNITNLADAAKKWCLIWLLRKVDRVTVQASV